MPCRVFRKRFPLFGDEVFLERTSGQQVFIQGSVLLSPFWGHSLLTRSRHREVCSVATTVAEPPFRVNTGPVSQGRRGRAVLFYLKGGGDMTGREFLQAGELGSVLSVWTGNKGSIGVRWRKAGKGRGREHLLGPARR